MEKVLLVGFPKSGNTWLGYMLSYMLNAQYVEPYNFIRGTLYDKDERILRLTSGNLDGREKTKYSMVIKTHALPVSENEIEFYKYPKLTPKVILIVRDPRDICVSYFEFRKNILPSKNLLKSSVYKFRHIFFYKTMKDWRRHTELWMKELPLIVKYEGLKKKPVAVLNSILDFLDVKLSSEIVNESINQFSFERLSKGRQPGSEDSKSFYRKGIVGDYKNYFNIIDKWNCKRICFETMRKLGYI